MYLKLNNYEYKITAANVGFEMSEDKKINLEYPPFDSEVPVTPSYIRRLLDNYFMNHTR